METGPLARMVVAYAKKMPRQKELVDRALAQAGVPVEALFSTLGRTLCRGLEAKMCAQLMLEYVDELEANIKAGDEVAANMDKWEPSTWPKECKGVGQCEAPRGALGHWCVIKDGVIAKLAGCCSDYVECFSARHQGPAWCLRSRSARHTCCRG